MPPSEDNLLGLPFPGPADVYPTKDQVASYLKTYSGFIATDSHRVWTSDDGASWTPVPTGSAFQGADAISVIAWGSRPLAVGDTNDHRNMVWISGPLR